jgi:ABC-type transport system involved in cytochrome bd biosynthesis fused ATPase/permease subunit
MIIRGDANFMISIKTFKIISIILVAIIIVFLVRFLHIFDVQIASVILVIMIIISLISVLVSMNQKLKVNIMIEKEKESVYQKEVARIQKINETDKKIEEINNVARDFFKKRLDLKESLTYLELAKEFNNQKKKKHEEFCVLMANLLYSGIKIKQEDINKLLKLFQGIINS